MAAVSAIDLEQLNAHTPRKGSNEWHKLNSHLQRVAKLAARFSRAFGAADLGYLAGLWHDLGKVNPDFQKYLLDCALGKKATSVPHANNGAVYAYLLFAPKMQNSLWPEITLPILGHHAGLMDVGEASQRLHNWDDRTLLRQMINMANSLPLRKKLPTVVSGTRQELRLRMIFSSLVDADYLDTEKHFDPKHAEVRGERTRPVDLWPVFRSNQMRLMWNNRNNTGVNAIRRQIYNECIRNAKLTSGIFRLMVPTGGGKTRSGLAFALRHAVEHPEKHFHRIIVALPYTSIVDQTASEYRRIFGDRLVLEHQSQSTVSEEAEDQEEQTLKVRLASENWDHPLIVTTTVQLFESLFNNKPSHCRKLHNIAQSIIILDEIQTLPAEMMEPTFNVLRDLIEDYGVTVVLSTATQPALDNSPYLKAFEGMVIRDVVSQPERFFQHDEMKRVEYQLVRWDQDLDALADEICKAEQVMVVFNTRKTALDVHDRLLKRNATDVYHLSTLLCGEHRRHILQEVKKRLDIGNPQPIRLISTQVVEAGVDLDFPVVYRALGPLDRIVQAAGRCNREGRRKEKGKVVIFDFPGNKAPPGAYRIGLDDSKILLERNGPEQLHNTDLYTEYFQCLFRDVNLDKRDIQSYRGDLNYPEVAKRYKLIEETALVVIGSYNNGEGDRRLQQYLHEQNREAFRELMPYTVNIRYDELRREEIVECLEEVKPGLYRWIGGYDDINHQGLLGIVRDPADLIV